MNDSRHVLTSLTRIADLDRRDYAVMPVDRQHWKAGDYVAGRVTGTPNALYQFELVTGRMIQVLPPDVAIGVFGERSATLEGTGSWTAIGSDGAMHSLTSAGLFGCATSQSTLLPPLMTLDYLGHVARNGNTLAMADFVDATPDADLTAPVILLVGTSMSAGKTTTGRTIVRALKAAGLRVTAAKLTGAGRFRDIQSFADAGADCVVDFVDAGLPSTVVPEEDFRAAMRIMLGRIAASRPDVAVIEAGASPLEPYNGGTAIDMLRPNICVTVLCASDPYAAFGVQQAFPLDPDIVAGPAAATKAAIALVRKLSGLPAVNVLTTHGCAAIDRLLRDKLGDRIAGLRSR